MKKTAIIGGSSLQQLDELECWQKHDIDTPYGQTSASILQGELLGKPLYFLARHGTPHQYPPHKINYQANIWALHQLGIQQIIAFAAVGGINPHMLNSCWVMPDQIIDYTYAREPSFFDGTNTIPDVSHIDFTEPFDEPLRQQLIEAAQAAGLKPHQQATHAITQGPRLESKAEVKRLAQDGCDIVGMTSMPEAALAKELNIAYATAAFVVNPAAGIKAETIDMQKLYNTMQQGAEQSILLLKQWLK